MIHDLERNKTSLKVFLMGNGNALGVGICDEDECSGPRNWKLLKNMRDALDAGMKGLDKWGDKIES